MSILSRFRRSLIIGLLFLLAVLAAAAALLLPGLPEDTTYLTPIPQQTLAAYKLGLLIETKLQAVIAAREMCCGKAFFIGTPIVRLVEETSLGEAQKRVAVPGSYQSEDRSLDTKVWFVVLQGDLQVDPPPDPGYQTHTPTPTILQGGCTYVIIQAENPSNRSQNGGIACPSGRLDIPITQVTLDAYRRTPGTPVENRQEAAILARLQTGVGHFPMVGDSIAHFAEGMTLADAAKKVGNPNLVSQPDYPTDLQVWLVILEGETQLISFGPDHSTDPPPAHGCRFVIINASDSAPIDDGSIACP